MTTATQRWRLILFESRRLIDNFEVDPFILPPLALVVCYLNLADFGSVLNVCAAICLEVQAVDLYYPDLVDASW